MLARPATPDSVALKAAKVLVRQWPHARPLDTDDWQIALAAALSVYPSAIVEECVDPRRGLARTREFPPTVAAVHDWCGARLDWYAKWAQFVPIARRPQKPDAPRNNPKIPALLAGLAKLLRWPQSAGQPQFRTRGPTDAELRAHYTAAREIAS